jgi:hypothetical protein
VIDDGVGAVLEINKVTFLVPSVSPLLVHLTVKLYVPTTAAVVQTNCPLVVADIEIQLGSVPLVALTLHVPALVISVPVLSPA